MMSKIFFNFSTGSLEEKLEEGEIDSESDVKKEAVPVQSQSWLGGIIVTM